MLMNTEQEVLDLVMGAAPDNPLEYVEGILRPAMRDRLDQCILDCSRCPMGERGAVKAVTAGDDRASIMFVCEDSDLAPNDGDSYIAPMRDPDEWAIMLKLIEGYNINKNELFWINAVNCHTEVDLGNGQMQFRPPNTTEVCNCKKHVLRAIEIMKPKLVFLLGNIPYNMFQPGKAIKQNAGLMFEAAGVQMMPTYSPKMIVDMERNGAALLDEIKSEFCESIYQGLKYLQDNGMSDNILLSPLS